MRKIDADEIHRYAFVPQCCDNQFVPDKLLSMFDPESKKHREKRYEETRGELIRSMIYSSQILVNRIAFFNNDIFLDFYGNKDEKKALIDLFNEQRIITVLYNEKEFSRFEIENKNEFTINDRIGQFFDFLDHNVKDSGLNYCVISEEDEVMARIRAFLSPFFGALSDVTNEETTEIVKEISPDRIDDSDYIMAFKNHLWNLSSEYVRLSRAAKETGKSFNREQMYKQWIIKEGTKPAGMYIDRNKEFAVETKKLVDLAYNYNLSAAFSRYFFCPEGMPTPLIIPASLRSPGSTLNNADEYKEAVQRDKLIYESQRTYRVPDAKKLTLGQVVMIQKTAEWQNFIDFQRKLFDDPSKWNARMMWDYARVLGDMYMKIESDCREVPLLENLYLILRIVIKFNVGLTHYVDMGDAAQIISALDKILEMMERKKDAAIRAFIKVKHEFRNEKSRIMEEFANGLSDIELTYNDVIEMRKNYVNTDFTEKSGSEVVAQK